MKGKYIMNNNSYNQNCSNFNTYDDQYSSEDNYNTHNVSSSSTYNDPCESVYGNSIDLEVNSDDCEIKADILVSRTKSVRIWGQIKDCNNCAVEHALVKLLKITECQLYGLAHTVTDCLGFYQFEVPSCDTPIKYKIIVGKAAKGKERVVMNDENCTCSCNCNK